MKKIALEEHFNGPGFEQYLEQIAGHFAPDVLQSFEELLPEFDQLRLAAMDKAEIEIMVLSQTAPGLQREEDTHTAIKLASQSNDFLASQIARHPTRYRGFACLALQDVTSAVDELERCVEQLGFVGALINGHTNGSYLDEERYWPFWERVEALDVPVYLHPGDSYDKPHMYKNRPELEGAVWSWTCETATHALRLVFGGTFDRFPRIKVILGHMGETLPFSLWRFDSRAKTTPAGRTMKKPPSQYIKDHFAITTSGVCADAPLMCSLMAMGEDSIMFSVDYPYEEAQIAANFIENAPISESVREKLCYKNAERLLGL